MSDIFLSYKREDEDRVLRLVRGLESEKLAPWWDHGLPGGENWRARIETALDAAKVVIVVWTHASTGPDGDFVRDEASRAKKRGVLVPVLMERGVRQPLGFNEVQAIDLSHWRSSPRDPFFRDLVAVIRAKLNDMPAPAAKGRMARLVQRAAVAGIAGTTAAGALAFGVNLLDVQENVCSLPGVQPWLSDTCGALGLGDKPTYEARIAFESLPAGDCEALAAFRTTFETSPLRQIADSRLADRRPAPEPQWVSRELRLPLFHPQTARTSPSESAARDAALSAAQGQSERLCRTAGASDLYRIHGATPVAQDWTCEPVGRGYACSFMGETVCAGEERITTYQCGGVD